MAEVRHSISVTILLIYMPLLSLILLAYVETLISLNKKDILLAKERFGHRRKKPAEVLRSQTSFMELTDEEKKVRKAQQFGVRIVPDMKVNSSKDDKEIHEHIAHSLSHDSESGNSDVALELHPSHDHTPSVTPTPKPRARRRKMHGSKERLSTPVPLPRSSKSLRRSETELDEEWRPVPMKRRHMSNITGSEGEVQLASPMPIPRPRSRYRSSLELDTVGLERPVPKPRQRASAKGSTSEVSLVTTPRSSLEESAGQMEFLDHLNGANGGGYGGLLEANDTNTFISVPAYILDAGSTESLDNFLNNGDLCLSKQENHIPNHTYIDEETVSSPVQQVDARPPMETPGVLPGKMDAVEMLYASGTTSRAKTRPRSMVVMTTTQEEEEYTGIRGERSLTVGAWNRNKSSQGPPMVCVCVCNLWA